MASVLLAGIRHRGPDDEGVARPVPTATLINTRLAIIDLSPAGHQPMFDAPASGQKPNCVVYNGEIYNYPELRRELTELGFEFRSRCDTEAILHAWRAWGDDCVDHMRGMFAICIVDESRGIATLYRDRLGIKPLYVYRHPNGGLVFASEIRAILALGADTISPRANRAALEGYLAQGAVQGYESLIDGIEMLAPATTWRLDLETGRELTRRTYWHLPPRSDAPLSRPQALEQLRSIAREAVAMHLLSDAPLGLFLSGGVDSASILALAAEAATGTLRTLTIGFDAGQFDESADSQVTAGAFGVDHRTIRLSASDVLDGLDAALGAMDSPTVDGFNSYFVSRAARQAGLTVALSGLGGDELFGGYASFADVPRAIAIRQNLLKNAAARVGGAMMRSRLGAKLTETSNRPAEPLAMYLLRRELFLPHERRMLHPLPDGCDEITGVDDALLDELRAEAGALDETNRLSFFELNLYMRHMLLRDADAFSMAAPIEYRVPLLDHRLVEAVFAMPGEWKRPDPRPKPLLLDIVGPRLPEAVWKRSKRGFTFPWGVWLLEHRPLANLARDSAHDAATWRDLGVEPAGVREIWSRFTAGDRRVSALQVLAFVVLRDFAVRHHLRAA